MKEPAFAIFRHYWSKSARIGRSEVVVVLIYLTPKRRTDGEFTEKVLHYPEKLFGE